MDKAATAEKPAVAVVLIKTSGRILLMTDRNNRVQGFESKVEALRFFERAYEGAHARGFEPSMSACINFITFHPSVVEVEGGEPNSVTLRKMFNIADDDSVEIVTVNNVSGTMSGIDVTKAPNAEKLWKNGATPQLIRCR